MQRSILAITAVVLATCSNAVKPETAKRSIVRGDNVYPEPPATFDAAPYTKWDDAVVSGKSRRAEVFIPLSVGADSESGSGSGSASGEDEDMPEDFVRLLRIDLVGNNYQRGYDHGYLLAKEIVEFAEVKMNEYFAQMVLGLDLSAFPEPLQKILGALEVKAAEKAPAVFREAMRWVWETEFEFTPQFIKTEIKGIATGVCDSPYMSRIAAQRKCDPAALEVTLQELNMLPELIRMACTAYGAWGKATGISGSEEGGLVQMRALDFGGGPFANYTVIATHRSDAKQAPSAADADKVGSFVTVTFPGFVGVITGVSESGIGISEKVWMTYDTPELQPGSYHGQADAFVLRDLLEFAPNREAAEKIIMSASRTWGMWVGIGDYATQRFDLVAYKQESAVVLDDELAPTMTGQPFIDSVAYVDKHPQPTSEGVNGTLPTALQDFYGEINQETSKIIIQHHKSGDLHIASYDFTNKAMYVSIGRINAKGEYGPANGNDMSVWKAYNRPYVRFALEDLWKGI